tara:strand:- start:1231 stop:1380 length:150 start_codon:yes stop_codon:yes gene_type:complete
MKSLKEMWNNLMGLSQSPFPKKADKKVTKAKSKKKTVKKTPKKLTKKKK